MTPIISKPSIWTTASIACILLFAHMNSALQAQSVPPQLLSENDLDNLVAPIALYPDPLLSQVLAAATYPLEIVEARQWLQGNGNLQGQRLMEAAKQQDWDPSVQLLVAFPDVLALCSRDIRWTTSLGNAFLSQQAEVMNAIQRLRARANQNGRLATTPQQLVSTEVEDGQSAIQIQPADPQIIYPPVYNPSYVWGSSGAGDYTNSSYPQGSYSQGNYSQGGYGSGSGFGSGTNLGGLFSGLLGGAGSLGNGLGGGLLGGLGGWGWILNWFTHTLSLNDLFFNGLGFNNFGGGYHANGGFNGPAVWTHNPDHRRGIPYSNGFRAAGYRGTDFNAGSDFRRFRGSSFAAPGFADSGSGRAGSRASDGWHHFAGRGAGFSPFSSAGAREFQPANRMTGSYDRGWSGEAPYRSGFASNGGRREDFRQSSGRSPQMASNFRNAAPFGRSSEPQPRFEAPRMSSQHFSSKLARSEQHFSAPRFSSSHSSAPRGSSHFSQPHHSGGGHSGKSRHKH
jgi:hypothetical protein